jgi:cysteine/O-acetylserine efflux protein
MYCNKKGNYVDKQAIIAFLAYAVINAISPGPGNILALNTIGNYGWKNSKRLLYGIFTGYYFTQMCCAIFTFGLVQLLNPILSVIKYIGAFYIVWLAIHIAKSKPNNSNIEKKSSFITGFILQCVNVKILLFGVTALTGYIVPYHSTFIILLLFSLIIATIGSAATIIWCLFGAIFQNYYKKYFKQVNIVLAVVLIWCAFNLVF